MGSSRRRRSRRPSPKRLTADLVARRRRRSQSAVQPSLRMPPTSRSRRSRAADAQEARPQRDRSPLDLNRHLVIVASQRHSLHGRIRVTAVGLHSFRASEGSRRKSAASGYSRRAGDFRFAGTLHDVETSLTGTQSASGVVRLMYRRMAIFRLRDILRQRNRDFRERQRRSIRGEKTRFRELRLR
jgi:hypothetical protein